MANRLLETLSKALMTGRLTARQRELLALAVAQANSCRNCLSAHMASSKLAGLSDADILKARAGKGDHPLENGIPAFAVNVVHQKRLLFNADITAARGSGIDDGLMLEIVANIALNTLSNYTNHLVDPEVEL